MCFLVTRPSILPSRSTAATLYSLPMCSNGSPTTTTICLFLVASSTSPSPSSADDSSASCKNRSLQVYPVMHNSGNTRTATCMPEAATILSTSLPALPMQSPTTTSGVHTSTLTKPSFITATHSGPFNMTFLVMSLILSLYIFLIRLMLPHICHKRNNTM